ncbi:T9SS type A sorting domain-containing protein, partial [Candidatus Kapabacteria bacterium]|nr:T9SS type A sorting domain-containing protein [Candidatus Kapabacteria bacterium]
RRPIYVTATGLKPEYKITPIDTLDFGDVFIGQSTKMSIDIENIGLTQTQYRNDLFQGDVFEITTNTINGIANGSTRKLEIEFKPIEAINYFDNVRVWDIPCSESYVVAIKGRGVIDAFDYSPSEVRIDNITACKDSIINFKIINSYSTQLDLSNFVLNDPSNKFSIISPSNLLNRNIQLDPSDELEILLRYDPSDLSGDRSDIAFIEYEALNQDWSLEITGTSIVPRLYMTDEVSYGGLEVTTSKQDTVTIENITGVDVAINGFVLKDGVNFKIIKPLAPFDTILKPRDDMKVVVEFSPDNPINYNDSLFVLIEEPCEVPTEFAVGSHLRGIGELIPLDISQLELSFGQVSPCDCETKVIPLRNRSRNNSIQIDSVIIGNSLNSATINNASEEYFTWKIGSLEQLPVQIANAYVDSLYLTYCPRASFERDSLLHNAVIQILASGPGWSTSDEIYMSGRQMLLYETIPPKIDFSPTRVDIFAGVKSSITTIPSSTFNEAQAPITVDSITFVPDEKVFTYSSTFSNGFPLTFTNIDSLFIDVDFKPRSPREYKSKMFIHISSPCALVDSTVEISGSGYAPAFGLDFIFKDTITKQVNEIFELANCDTLKLPVFTSRNIPGELVNIYQKIKYDTLNFKFEGISSKYLYDSCLEYIPSYEFELDNKNYVDLSIFNFCNVTTENPIYIANFTMINGFDQGSRSFSVDSIFFDTEEVILFDIAATPALSTALISKADFQIINNVDFGGVNILDCTQDSLILINNGDISLFVDDLLESLNDVKVIDVFPPYGSKIDPLDSVKILLEFCPTSKNPFESNAFARVSNPCLLIDSTLLKGFGTTPPYEVSVDISESYLTVDTIGGNLKDIINVPIYFEKNMSVTYNQTEYWIENFDFSINFEYNPRALKYLSFSSDLSNNNIFPNLGLININYFDIDSLSSGKIGEMQFEVTLADSLYSEINIIPEDFDAEIMFYDIIPILQKSIVNSVGACNLTFLNYSDNPTTLNAPFPNPVNSKSTIYFTTLEKAEISLEIYDLSGNLIKRYFNQNQIYDSGEYFVDVDANDFSPGVYYYILKSGNFFKTQKMVISK